MKVKRLLTATALALSLLTGAANAAPTCHQKVAVVGMTNFDKVLPIVNKINPLINGRRKDNICDRPGHLLR